MDQLSLISLCAMSAIYIIAGVTHFRKPKFFLKIMPKWVPFPELMNRFVGALEIILGISILFESIRSYAAIGLIILLIAIFPANIYHFQKSLKKKKYVLATLIRLPIQGLLIYWAYTFV